jgi:hypothetical protein
MTDTTEQQLAAARAEIERLTALLPPLPADGQVWRVGSKCRSNLYAHADDLAPKGEPVGVMRSAELAAHVVQAVNARANESHGTPAGAEGGREDLRATIARVRDLAEAAKRTGCGAGWTLDPAEVLAALDRSDLPAVREFAADFDPRGEPPCPTT